MHEKLDWPWNTNSIEFLKSNINNQNYTDNINLYWYTEYELYDYIKFFNLIGYKIYDITKINDIKIVLDELKTMPINKEYMKILFQIIKTFYNILDKEYKLDHYKSIMNYYKEKYETNNDIINLYLNKFIKNNNNYYVNTNSYFYKKIIISSFIGIVIINYYINI